MTQVCSNCRADKDSSCYYSDKSKKSGLDIYCKDCRRELKKAGRRKNPEQYAAKQKRFRERHPSVARLSTLRQTATKPRAVRAREIVHNELKRGRLTRRPCESCGATKRIHGHHDDYSQPTVVRWLCALHHREWHDVNGPGANLDEQSASQPNKGPV